MSEHDHGIGMLRELIAPMTLEEFRAEYWEKRYLHVPGALDRVSRYFYTTVDEFIDVSTDRYVDAVKKVVYISGLRPNKEYNTTKLNAVTLAASREAGQLMLGLVEQGNSFEVQGMHSLVPRLGRGVTEFQKELGFVGEVSFDAMLSPRGAGAPVHLDPTATMTIQVHGKKKWWVSREATHRWPASPYQIYDGGVAEPGQPRAQLYDWENPDPAMAQPDQLVEFELNPGDFLYIPAGTWHSTEATSDVSYAMLIQFFMVAWPTLITDKVLLPKLRYEAEWRSAPLLFNTQHTHPRNREILKGWVKKMRDILDDLYTKDIEHVEEVFLKCLATAIDDASAEIASQIFVNDYVKENLGIAPSFEVTPDTMLEFREMASCVFFYREGEDGKPKLVVAHSDREFEFQEPRFFPWAHQLAQQLSGFRAGDSVNWAGDDGEFYQWSEIKERLETLMAERILIRKP